jgi:hypothetical protein
VIGSASAGKQLKEEKDDEVEGFWPADSLNNSEGAPSEDRITTPNTDANTKASANGSGSLEVGEEAAVPGRTAKVAQPAAAPQPVEGDVEARPTATLTSIVPQTGCLFLVLEPTKS